MAKNTVCLWYDKDPEAAARFYAKTFPDSEVGNTQTIAWASLRDGKWLQLFDRVAMRVGSK